MELMVDSGVSVRVSGRDLLFLSLILIFMINILLLIVTYSMFTKCSDSIKHIRANIKDEVILEKIDMISGMITTGFSIIMIVITIVCITAAITIYLDYAKSPSS